MKKKNYEKPKMEFIEISSADVIATSTQSDFTMYPNQGYVEEPW